MIILFPLYLKICQVGVSKSSQVLVNLPHLVAAKVLRLVYSICVPEGGAEVGRVHEVVEAQLLDILPVSHR